MRTEDKELLAVGIFGTSSQLGDRIEMLLTRRREFSPRASIRRAAASTTLLAALAMTSSLAPRWIAFAQARPTFDVASVKPGDPNAPFLTGSLTPGRYTSTNATLKNL